MRSRNRGGSGGQCLGFLDAKDNRGSTTDASYIAGWAWDAAARRAPDWILLVDQGGVIRGLGRSGLPRPDVEAAVPDINGSKPGWRAYLPLATPIRDLTAKVLLADGYSVCPLGSVNQ